eukprot:jgi/Picre1/33662/NNA_001142.t1
MTRFAFFSSLVLLLFCGTQRAASSAGRSLSQVWTDPGLCFNLAEATTTAEDYVLPINNVLDCLRKVRLNQDFRTFSGLGSPQKSVFVVGNLHGSSGGQVNYEKEFNELIEEIKSDGADGTLSYRITDIITQARDAHSGPVDWPLGSLNLIQTSSDAPVWLNLRLKEGSSEVEVVGNVIGLNGTGVAETKKPTASTPRWSSSRTGDISKLPARLDIEYEDGSSTTWAFAIPVPSDLALLPTGELAQSLQTPAGGDSGSLGNGTNILGFDIFKDRTQDPPVTFSGYTVVNEDTMVWKLPTFLNPSSLSDVVNFWNAMVMEAENQAITETMTSKKNVDTIESYLKDVDVEDFKEGVKSILEVLRNAAFLAASTGSCTDFSPSSLADCLNTGGNDRNWVNVNYTSMSDLLTIAQDVLDLEEDWADASESDLLDLMSTFLDRLGTAINRPSYCASINETCKTITNKQGGVEVLSSDYFKSTSMAEETLKQVRSASKGNPFKSFVLLSNAQLVGSAANIFESALRHISSKYSDTIPKTTGVSIGCLGDASQCDMTSFQGQIANGPKFVGSLYAMYGILSALQQTVNLFPDSVVSELEGISKEDIGEYGQATERYLAKLPKPPMISSTIPQYNTLPIYSLELPKETIPQEFFNRPPEGYLPIWPAPQSTSLEEQSSLPEIYQELQQFF